MLAVTVNDRQFGLAFSHTKYQAIPKSLSRSQRKKLAKPRVTECRILEITTDGGLFTRFEVAKGLAPCSLQDNFCKETGRLVALTKALREARKSGHPFFLVNSAETARQVQAIDAEFLRQYALKRPVIMPQLAADVQ